MDLLLGADSGYHLLKKISFGAAEGGREYFDYIYFRSRGEPRLSFARHRGYRDRCRQRRCGPAIIWVALLSKRSPMAGGTIYDNLEDKNEVIAIDSRALKITAHWPVAPAGQPVSIAMDRQHRHLFIGGRNPKLLVVMARTMEKLLVRHSRSARVWTHQHL